MTLSDISTFYNNLSVMLNSGVGLTSLFESIANSERDNPTKLKYLQIVQHLKHGRPLYVSLKQASLLPVFDIPIIEAGEKAGKLPHVFEILAKNYELSAEAEKNSRSGLILPFFTLAGALLLPKFPDFFLGKITGTQYLKGSAGPLILFVFFCFALHRAFMLSYFDLGMARMRHQIMMFIPILNSLTKKMAQEKFCTSLALMLEAGLPIFEAIKLAGATSADPAISSASTRIVRELTAGKPLPATFRSEGVFNDDIVNSITLGNESGQIPKFLARSGQMMKKQIDDQIRKITKAIPIIIYWGVVLYGAWTMIEIQAANIKMLENILDG